ncbi:MAG: D-alanyl-lipoteichoic acid biosynthesis protein DltD [Candidatus Melainabacteria bacterium]|nr:D-alanyl-lipoteichoic acid biosynthesis protein DltD [Candidatus Melainabacteria bacterium]
MAHESLPVNTQNKSVELTETEASTVPISLPYRSLNSFSLWILLLLVASSLALPDNFLILAQVPQEKISAALVTKSAINFKMNEWKTNSKNVDLVVIGSSLPMCCLYYADDPKNSLVIRRVQESNQNPLQAYTAADYLERAISKKHKRDYKVFNATVAASMISDIHLLASKLLENPPKTILLGVGMRDFADNINCSFGSTPTYQALFDVKYALTQDNLDFTYSNTTKSVREELASCIALPLYRNHLEMQLALNTFAEKLYPKSRAKKEPIKIKSETDKITVKLPSKIEKMKTDVVLDSLGYEKRYMPPNYKQMNVEAMALERLCELCKSKNVELILINMPVSSQHQTLSSREMRAKYLQTLQNISTKYGVKYIDFENKNLIPDQDFLDTVHMGPPGAVKFVDYLVGECGIFRN